jgi:AAA domain
MSVFPIPGRHAVAEAATRVRRERVEWREPGRVPMRMVTVLAGVGGLGKSQLSCLWAANNPGVTLIATAEDSPSATVRPRLEAVNAKLELVQFVSIQCDDGIEDGLTIPDDIDELERLVMELAATLVIVDPLVAHLPLQIDSHKDQSVRRALAPLYRLAEACGCAVVALMHLNKALGLAPLARLSGSGAFGNLARSVLLLDHDPDDPDGEEGSRRVLAHVKCNVAPLAPSLLYEVEPILLPAEGDQPEVDTSRLTLLGESPHNGRALLSVASDEERDRLGEAKDFLEAELADGIRHLAGDLFKAARQLGIADRTLQRARKNLGVETEKAGFGRGWEWWLTKAPSQPPEPAFLHEPASPPGLAPTGRNGGRRVPIVGDPDYPDWIDQKCHQGHLTELEWMQQRKLHDLVAGSAD